MRRLGILTFLLAAIATSAIAQQPVTIHGRVIAAENERPLRGARVAPTTSVPGVPAVLTDDEGRFELTIRDSVDLLVSKAGFATTRIERPRDSRAVARPLEIRLSKGAAVSGRVADDTGIAAIGARVVALRVDNSTTYVTQTDDLGEYRIGGLAPGRYTLSVNALPTTLLATDAATAQVIGNLRVPSPEEIRRSDGTRTVTVQAGDDRGGVDVLLRLQPFTSVMQATRAAADTPAARTPSKTRIEGRVIASSGAPVGAAIVQATGRQPFNGVQVVGVVATTTTDATGRFALELPQDGEYQLQTAKAAYLSSDPSRQRVEVGSGLVPPIELTMTPGGVITGTIVDSAGEPFQGVRVSAMQVRSENGRVVATRTGWERVTDDRGRYRVFGLPAGSYIVMASTDAVASGTNRDQRRGFARTYYPGTARGDSAQLLQVQAGRDLTEIDLSVVPTVVARVSGTVVDSTGQPFTGRVQLAVSRQSGGVAVEPLVTTAESDGRFELRDVSSGDYVVQAISEGRFGQPGEFGVESVAIVDRDPPPVTIRTSPGVTLEGRFSAGEGVERPPMRTLSLHAMTIDLDRGPAAGRGPSGLAVYDDGRFYITGLRGSVRFTVPNPPPGWFLKALTIGGVDVTDASYDFGTGDRTPGEAEVVLSSTGAIVKGKVTDGPQSRLRTCAAVAFSTARQLWFSGSRHVKQSRTCGDGSFSIDGLPPGDYWVVAVEQLEPGDWQIPEVLDAMVPMARRVTVLEGQTQSADVRVFRPSMVR
jgi:hypothetical protein